MEQVEKLAADQILQKGVPLQMHTPFLCRVLGWKTVSLKVTSPMYGTLLRVSSYYLSTGINIDQLTDITHEEALALMAVHGKAISKAVACGWLNGYWAGRLFTRPLAWYLRQHCTAAEIANTAMMLLIFGGTADFTNTTRSVGLMKVTAPRLGQETEGS